MGEEDGPPFQHFEHVEAMENIAVSLRAFYNALVAQGFDETQAMSFTTTWMTTMLLSGTRGG